VKKTGKKEQVSGKEHKSRQVGKRVIRRMKKKSVWGPEDRMDGK